VVPRLHVAYDVTGDGKTVVKGGWGRFAHRRQLDPELTNSDPQVRTVTTYRWHDLDGNHQYDPGEVDFNANGPDYVVQSGGSNTFANPNEQEPMSDEAYVSLERELTGGLAGSGRHRGHS
jgi:hypothetical protein